MADVLPYASSVLVAAAPQTLYGMVADVTRMGEWSPVCTSCWWDPGADTGVGSWFTGRNETPTHTWETRCRVTVADPGRAFAFTVDGVGAIWNYTFADRGTTTLLTESWLLLPAGVDNYRRRFGDDADRQIAIRRDRAVEGIGQTLAALRAAAESP